MFNIDEVLNKYNLTDEKYNELLKECSEKLCGISDLDWSELSEKYNLGFAGDTLRKAQQVPLVGGSFIRDYYINKYSKESKNIDYNDGISSKLRELERKKIQFRDERNAWNKQNYSNARVEQKLDYLESVLKDKGSNNYKVFEKPIIRKHKKEMIVMLSDLHIGQCFNNTFGEYDSDIAVERLNKYFDSVYEYAELFDISNVYIVTCGDLISGNIHKAIQITNREDVINQIKIASDLISDFCYKCSNVFENVKFYNVSGNHSRIDRKDDSLHSERLDDLIGWIVSKTLSHIENFEYIKNVFDNGIAVFDIMGKSYIACHGDFDSSTSNGIGKLSMMLGFIPYAILRGHLHYPSYNEINGVKVIQSGSIVGTGDQYTLEKRLTGKPSQTICICDNTGIKLHIPVEL